MNDEGAIEQTLAISPDLEIGYFVIGNFDDRVINQAIKSCDFSPQEMAKLHIATGSDFGSHAVLSSLSLEIY